LRDAGHRPRLLRRIADARRAARWRPTHAGSPRHGSTGARAGRSARRAVRSGRHAGRFTIAITISIPVAIRARGSAMSVYDKLSRLGITLPPVSVPAAAYVPFVQTGKLVFLSGHLAK